MRPLFILLLASAVVANAQPVTLRVGYLPATHDSLLFIAVEQNLFDSTKVRVEPRGYENSVQILSDLRAGNLDVGIPGVASPAAEIGGQARMTIVGGAAAQSAAVVAPAAFKPQFDAAKSLNAKIALFKGKRIGAVRGSTGLAVLRQGLRGAGLDDRTVEVKEFNKPSEIVSFLVSGNLDFGLLWSPHMTLAEAKGLPIVMWMTEILPNHVCCRQVARDEFLSNREALAAYLAGLIRANGRLDEARRTGDGKAAIVNALSKYLTTLTPDQMDLEIFGSRPRTTVSADLDAAGIDAYLKAMQAANLMNPQQCDSVRAKVKSDFLELALVQLGCTAAAAKECARNGTGNCSCAHLR